MTRTLGKTLLLSDFTIANLAGAMRRVEPSVQPVVGPPGEVMPVLLDAGHGAWQDEIDSVVIWTQPQSVLPAFAGLYSGASVDSAELLAEVDRFADNVLAVRDRARTILLPTWTAPHGDRGIGMLDLTDPRGTRGAVLRMNARLVERFAGETGAFLLDTSRWLTTATGEAHHMRLWYSAKIPYGPGVFAAAATDIAAALRGVAGRARKLVIVDLDNTMWGGVVGETGWEGIRLGGHDPVGEAYVDFQRALKSLADRGVVLGIVSKNEESVALEAIRVHPEMQLREHDFAGWRINWNDKAANVADLVKELNVGLDSVVFLDDHPAEQARVRETLTDVLVPEWPEDPLQYASLVRAMPWFDQPVLSDEDRQRTQMYVAERQRGGAQSAVGSLDEWLATLELTIQIEPLDTTNSTRTAQLLNKTNQMNLRTRRLTEAELTDWSKTAGHSVWTIRVADRFGDQGLTGIVSTRVEGEEAWLEDFVLSCRVFGRRVEDAMLHHAIDQTRRAGAASLRAELIVTPRNAPTLSFFADRSNMSRVANEQWRWNLDEPYPAPAQVTIHGPPDTTGATTEP